MHPVRIALLMGFLALAGAGAGMLVNLAGRADAPEFATVLPDPRPLPDFSLEDQEGKPFTNADLTGAWHAVFFGFTHCPDICPATLQQLAIARDRAIRTGLAFPRIVLISVDPERDSPAVLAAYVGHFGEDVIGLTGDPGAIRDFASAVGVYFARSGEGSAYSVDHSAYVLILDDRGRWHSLFRPPHSVDRFLADLPALMGAG